MVGAKTGPASVVQYELEIEIEASPERVWTAIIEETNCWWLPDFHMVGADSIVTFDPTPGGKGMVENLEGGGGLLWYAVHYHDPKHFTIYLVGHIAPDWGGPSTSNLKLSLEESENGCTLKVADAQYGNVSQQSVQSLVDGWGQLFSKGLKAFVEDGIRQDN
jgi:uncharacterized protein YndB with AHSA1/START domain